MTGAERKAVIASGNGPFRRMTAGIVESSAPHIRVEQVEDGASLVDRVKGDTLSLVIIDDMIGEYCGMGPYDAVRVIRMHDKRLPIYVMRGSLTMGDFKAAKEAGATGYIGRSENPVGELETIASKHLGRN